MMSIPFLLGGRMKVRNAQSDPRKNPDSPRVHGLRLTSNPPLLGSEGQIENPPENKRSALAKRVSLPSAATTDPLQAVEPLLDCSSAAVILGGLHPKTVERWAREGRIPAYRYFRRWKFRVSDLEVWMHSHVHSGCHPCRLNKEKADGT
jgi:excisionase family DNA binding protein